MVSVESVVLIVETFVNCLFSFNFTEDLDTAMDRARTYHIHGDNAHLSTTDVDAPRRKRLKQPLTSDAASEDSDPETPIFKLVKAKGKTKRKNTTKKATRLHLPTPPSFTSTKNRASKPKTKKVDKPRESEKAASTFEVMPQAHNSSIEIQLHPEQEPVQVGSILLSE